MSVLRFLPISGKAREILKAILQTPEVSSCAIKDLMLIRLACEELVMNITSYAYPEDVEGFLEVDVEKTDERIVIRFKDGGMPFNPLEHKKPDTKLPWKQRRIGGLGIFLLRRKMDDIHYDHVDNKNILTIEKVIQKLS